KQIRIFDINSKQVLKKELKSNELSIKNLKPGFYFLEVNGQFKKLIKE
ncbi:MAG: T9SS type A sorting domain-containing protein, partial [Polaribacter sp.]|nr:T9SS type A sorting domain-containing protein [Polaribacter sp.]